MRRIIARVLALSVLAMALTGCGYSQSTTYPADVRSVVLPIFENKTFYRNVEFDLTEAVVKEIEMRTPYKVVSNESTADTQLTGTITEIRQHRSSRRRSGGLPMEMEVAMKMDLEWRDLRSQQILRQRRGFEVVGYYIPTEGVGERFDVGQHQTAARMAEQIVSFMRSDW